MKVLHVIGGDLSLGASKGALILHNALIKEGVNSFILNNRPIPKRIKNAFSTHDYLTFKFKNIFYELLEKILKRFVSKKIVTTFTTSSFGVDIRKYDILKMSRRLVERRSASQIQIFKTFGCRPINFDILEN